MIRTGLFVGSVRCVGRDWTIQDKQRWVRSVSQQVRVELNRQSLVP